jgi:hypothetical protein
MTRYVLIAIPPLIVMISLGLISIKKNWQIYPVALIIIISLFCIYVQQNTQTKDDWKAINEYIDSKNVSQIGIVAYYEAMPLSYYHDNYCFLTQPNHQAVYRCLVPRGLIAIQTKYDIQFLTDEKIVLVTSRLDSFAKSSDLITEIETKYHIIENKTFYSYKSYKNFPHFFNIVDPNNPAFNKVNVYLMEKNRYSG